jgi:hypothetical protein
MSAERPEEFSQLPVVSKPPVVSQPATVSQPPASKSSPATGHKPGSSDDTARLQATVLVRGEAMPPPPKEKEKAPGKPVSEAKVKMQSRLPVLDDDSEVGVQKAQTVIRDGKADLAFTGKLLASAAPPSAPKGQWQEYRIYETNGGQHVFSKMTRTVFAEDQDTHEAEVFDPAPSSVPSQLLRSARDLARDLARSRPLTWMDAAATFFGYDPLAKTLYRKLSGQFEEHIN